MDTGGLSVDKIKEQISKYQKELQDLKGKSVKTTGSAKTKLEAQIKDLQSKIADAKAKLEKLSSQGKGILDKGKGILGKFKK